MASFFAELALRYEGSWRSCLFFSIDFLQTIFSIEKNKVLHCLAAKTMTEKNGGNNAWPRPVFWRGSRAVQWIVFRFLVLDISDSYPIISKKLQRLIGVSKFLHQRCKFYFDSFLCNRFSISIWLRSLAISCFNCFSVGKYVLYLDAKICLLSFNKLY